MLGLSRWSFAPLVLEACRPTKTLRFKRKSCRLTDEGWQNNLSCYCPPTKPAPDGIDFWVYACDEGQVGKPKKDPYKHKKPTKIPKKPYEKPDCPKGYRLEDHGDEWVCIPKEKPQRPSGSGIIPGYIRGGKRRRRFMRSR